MNINFRKSLRRSSRSSTFYLESFEMYDRSLKNLSLDNLNKFSNNSSPIVDFRPNEFLIPLKPILSVIKFDLNTERTKGMIGQIVLTNFRLKFIPYSHEQNTSSSSLSLSKLKNGHLNESNLNDESRFTFPPFELISTNESKTDENVEYLNIYDLICQNNLLQIYCSDFRCLEFQFKSNILVKCLAEQLERLIIKPINASPIQQLSQNLSTSISAINTSIQNITANRGFELTYFWSAIGSQYAFNYPKEWEQHEGYWYQTNTLLRISQANENYQLCRSLPKSFVTLKYYLTDVNLLQTVSAKMKGQRVPIVTYSHKARSVKSRNSSRINNRFRQDNQKDHMLIRSGMLTKELSYSLIQAISPLNIIEVASLLPDQQTFVSIYLKLREACFLHSNTNHFFSQIGKWMKLISKVLSIVDNLSKILNEESSVVLMENGDNHWNILLSCLIQITLDKNRRTIEGFNSLLSKEWIYLVGLRTDAAKLDYDKLPNQILFTLFLDCVYQMICQNSVYFEFTTLYLIRCFDLSFVPYAAFVKIEPPIAKPKEQSGSASKLIAKKQQQHQHTSPVIFSKFSSTNSLNLSHNHNSTNSQLSPILNDLTFTQTLFYFNPFSLKKQTDIKLSLSSSILTIQFWRPLYLRWSKPFLSLNYYNQFSTSECLYFKELVESNSGLSNRQIVQLDDQLDISSINNSLNDNNNEPEDSFEHF